MFKTEKKKLLIKNLIHHSLQHNFNKKTSSCYNHNNQKVINDKINAQSVKVFCESPILRKNIFDISQLRSKHYDKNNY